MKKLFVLGFILSSMGLIAQRSLPSDTLMVKEDRIRIDNSWLEYTVEVGTQPVWDTDGSEIAYLQYTYYQKKVEKQGAGSPQPWSGIGDRLRHRTG